jgi:valyl-tRNA synthetase
VYLNIEVDTQAEKERITKEIAYLEGFLKSVDAKLGNEKFVANAKPELVEKERQKKADAEAKLKILQNSIAGL